MQKGEFKGRKLSDLKPKTDTPHLERQPLSAIQPEENAATTPSKRPLRSLKPHEEAKKLLEAWCKVASNLNWDERKLSSQPSGKAILEASAELQLEVMLEALKRNANGYDHAIQEVIDQLARRNLPHTTQSIRIFLQAIGTYPHGSLFRNLVKPLQDPAILDACRPDLEALLHKTREWWADASTRKFIKLIEDTLVGQSGETRPVQIALDEWGAQAKSHLETLEADLRTLWQQILHYASRSSGSNPTQKWLEGATSTLETLGEKAFVTLTVEWLGFFKRSSNKPPTYDSGADYHNQTARGCLLDEGNADTLRGLVWLSSRFEDSSLAAALADAAIAGYKKISGVGPRSAKVAGAAVYALKTMPGLTAAAQLERVKLNVKQPTYLKTIETALETAAKNAGLSREDLEELTVPGYDFVNGKRTVHFGEARVELRLNGLEVDAQWFGADGKARKSEPTEVKANFKAELKALKLERDAIEKMLVAQRDRLERLPLVRRSWNFETWRTRYLEHPLLSGLTNRLIWHVQDGDRHTDAFWLEGRPISSDDANLEFSNAAVVTPWHPVHSDASEVLAWREFLMRHGVTQPFKQAHREVYILTEAERRTERYSNRFAAHIVKQHQFNALCAARGWRNQLRLMVDDSYAPPTLELPLWGLRAEYWVEGAGDQYGVDTNDTGTYLYLSTDQVRFYPLEATQNYAHAGGGGYRAGYDWTTRTYRPNEPIRLEDIPAVVFSELLRDVDLFVGVASVGNDPTWLDGGPQGHREYWQHYSFGELSATAETRKALLEILVPRLKIRDRAHVEGKFLKVRGDIRTYKIHLGSGNILMEPNDQYLCIVPGGSRDAVNTTDLRLPFEGDRVLAIILSKAFMLADDKAITDVTITRQLKY
jgi:hypothetical protein